MKEGDHRLAEVDLALQVLPEFTEQVDEGFLQNLVERVLVAEGIKGPVEISVVITDDAAIRSLNASYRGIDRPTDVLSFPLTVPGQVDGFVGPPDQPVSLGDVVISLPRAREQAEEYGHSLERELGYLIVHGVLHLLGYDHGDEADRRVMRSKEEAALGGD